MSVAYNTIMHFFNTLFLFFITKNTTKKEYSNKQKWGFILTGTLVISILYNTIYKKFGFTTANTLISIVIYITLSCIVLKNKTYQSAIGVGVFYILAAIGEAVSYVVFVQNMGFTPHQTKTRIDINIILHVISYTVFSLFLAISPIKRIIKNKKTNGFFMDYKKQAIIAMTITLLIIAYGIYGWFHNKLVGRTLIIMNVLLTLVFLLASMIYILTLQRVLSKNEENQDLKTYIKLTQELSEDLRRFKHNYRNLLYGLGGHIENEDWDNLRAYYNELLHASAEISSSDIYAMRNIKNNALFGLISQKIRFIKEKNKDINIQVLVPEEVEILSMKESDICEIVGVYLDNAIEAVGQADDKQIVFEMFKDDENLHIIIKNTFANTPDLSKIFDRGYSTKKEKGKGLGLYFAKNILNKYDNTLYNTYISDDFFVQEIIIQEKQID